MPKTPLRPPLYKVQLAAMAGDPEAELELGRRWAVAYCLYPSDAYRARVAAAYVKGWRLDLNPWRHGRGGNFAATLRRAYHAGQEARYRNDTSLRLWGRAEQAGVAI